MESKVHSRQRQLDGLREYQSQTSQERKRVLELVKRAEEIISDPDPYNMIQDFLKFLIEISNADSGYCFQLDTSTDELVLTNIEGKFENQFLRGLRLNQYQGLPGKIFRENQVSVIRNLTSDTIWMLTIDPENAAYKRNIINLPISYNEKAIGVIQIFNFEHLEIDLLLHFSTRLGDELGHRKDIDSIQNTNERLLLMMNMLGEVAGTLDRNRLLHLIAEDAARLVNAERSSLFLVNPSTREMIFQVAYQAPEKSENTPGAAPASPREEPIKPFPGILKNSRRISRLEKTTEGEFSYFNRSAITVPLHGGQPSQEIKKDKAHTLGGLMVLNKRNADFKEEDSQLIQILANQASTFLQVAEIYENTGELFLGVIKSMVAAIDAKDAYTQGHSQRVSDYSVMIARELKLDEAIITDIRIGSLLHDIGKIGIPDSILTKNSSLDEDEMVRMRAHPRLGVNILSQVKALDQMQPAINEHHERLDGSGYPNKLVGKQISLMGRIVAVADVFDAMTSDRPYRQALGYHEVLSFLDEKAEVLFDTLCIKALKNVLRNMNTES